MAPSVSTLTLTLAIVAAILLADCVDARRLGGRRTSKREASVRRLARREPPALLSKREVHVDSNSGGSDNSNRATGNENGINTIHSSGNNHEECLGCPLNNTFVYLRLHIKLLNVLTI
ncbi:hypothetical protein ElyMa_005415800 [Elysia marginata]|uniref:Secreted protein n=1 Tax=Elysia marginata TaxID=1093978 RepID=A0AAV4EJ39_9GAST|nr:hypothetical protein ElyMa_005415800 [Elysia marginata]